MNKNTTSFCNINFPLLHEFYFYYSSLLFCAHKLVEEVEVVYPAKTKHLYNICTMLNQRRIRWAAVVQMLYNFYCVCWDTCKCILDLHVLS